MQKIGSIRTLLKYLGGVSEEKDIIYFYRGHSDRSFELLPSIYRKHTLIENEDKLFKDILVQIPEEFKNCNLTFEKLTKMQHYSLPSRLLDITTNPLVALYFACDKDVDKDGLLYCFKVPRKKIKYFDSDIVSIISNIARLPIQFDISSIMNQNKTLFNKDIRILNLLQEIRREKPYFLPNIDVKDMRDTYCVKPVLNNPRIIKQEGAFFLFGIDSKKEEPSQFGFEKISYIINKTAKSRILRQLESFGIDESTLFPEIEHIAMYLRNKYS